jgi:hypothetical protein
VKQPSVDQLNTGIARIKLGRALARQHRYADALAESSARYAILREQMSPTVSWLQNARKDLVEESKRSTSQFLGGFGALGGQDVVFALVAVHADSGP